RTRFVERGGVPGQVIEAPRPIPLPLSDLSGEQDAEARLKELLAAEGRRPFDLEAGELIRVSLLRMGEDEHALVAGMHHITNDGWSLGILNREVAALYDAFSRGLPSPLGELAVQYADFAAWQRGWLTPERERAQVGFWRERLADAPELPLAADRAGPAGAAEGQTHPFALGVEASDGIRRLARELGATQFMTLLAAFKVLLHWQGKTDDVVVGTDIANRNLRSETEGLIGFFVNQLVLRTRVDGNPSFAEVVGRVRETTLSAYDHQDLPFDRVVEELKPRRAAGETPFFRAKFVLQNAPVGEPVSLPGLTLEPLPSERGAAQLDLLLTMHDGGDRIRGWFEHRTSRLSPELVARWARRLSALVEAAVSDPAARLDALTARLDADERREGDEAQDALRAMRQGRFARK
ncbi:MAG: non-ribosomal peptide synthetase, partial [Gemmatimonadetes bacterium]|nr:non-ribosomal peptide synthetase [Gemmatimonadota bacterium]